MPLTRRRFLANSCSALASLHPAFVWSSSNSADSIRHQYPMLYRELAVADSTRVSNTPEARVTLYGQQTPSFDLPTEILFRRDRIVALATVFGSNGSSDLSNADEDAVRQYVEGLAHTHQTLLPLTAYGITWGRSLQALTHPSTSRRPQPALALLLRAVQILTVQPL